MELEREDANRTRIGALRPDQKRSVQIEEGEDSRDRIRHALPGWLEHNLVDAVVIRVEDGNQDVLLGGKEEVDAARIGASLPRNVADAAP